MVKVRIIIKNIVEYEIDPEVYPPGSTPEECLTIDIENAKEDPQMFSEMEGTRFEVTGEIIK